MLGRCLRPVLLLCHRLAHGVSHVAVQACRTGSLLPQATAKGVVDATSVAVTKWLPGHGLQGSSLWLCKLASRGQCPHPHVHLSHELPHVS